MKNVFVKSGVLPVLLIILSQSILSQQQDPLRSQLYVIAKSYGDSVLIRWAPDKPVAWQLGNKAGYRVERLSMGKDSTSAIGSWQLLTKDTLRTWPLDLMKARLRNDRFAPIVAQAVYGKSFTPNSQGLGTKGLMNLALEQENRYSFALFAADNSGGVASALGLRFMDKTVEKGNSYLYRVISFVDLNKFKVDTGFILINTNKIESVPAAPDFTADGQEKKIVLEWNIILYKNTFGSYYIERSTDKRGKKWERLTPMPVVLGTPDNAKQEAYLMSYADSVGENYVPYKYRIIGITPFAELSEPSAVVTAWGRDRTPPSPIFNIEAKGLDEKSIEITWNKDVIEPDLKGFIIERSDKVDQGFQTLTTDILGKEARRYVDRTANLFAENYYRVLSVDTAGNINPSFTAYAFVVDSIPPAMPAGLEGIIDTNGIVTLKWKLGQEPDILGYRVFTANQADHQFANITPYPVGDTTFTDSISLNTLTKHVYYKVIAVDGHYNHSVPSKILELKRPDKVIPVKPLFSNVLVTDSSVVLTWFNSSSSDAVKTNLYRRTEKSDWMLIQSFDVQGKVQNYTDRRLTKKVMYYYTLEAKDDAGLLSGKCNPVSARVYDNGVRDALKNFNVNYNTASKKVEINWEYKQNSDLYFVIYRSYNDGDFTVYKSVDGEKRSYSDGGLVGNGRYQYAIRVVYNDGGQSPLSKRISLMVED